MDSIIRMQLNYRLKAAAQSTPPLTPNETDEVVKGLRFFPCNRTCEKLFFLLFSNVRSDDSIPPPLPPHGITANSVNVEYRPPVPPHRNICVTANINGQQPAGQRVSTSQKELETRRTRCSSLETNKRRRAVIQLSSEKHEIQVVLEEISTQPVNAG